MKKIIALLLVLCMLFAFAGCGAADDNGPSKAPVSSSVPVDDDFEDEEDEEKKEFPTLSGDDEYVVVRKIGTDFELKDITEIANYKVGLIGNTDSELIGLYYCDEENIAINGTDHDAFSHLDSKIVDIVICRKTAAEAQTDRFEIILDPIEMIKLK